LTTISRRELLIASAGGLLALRSAAPSPPTPAAGDDLCFMPAADLASAIRAKKLSPVEVMDAVFARIHALNPRINAYCTLTEELAKGKAKEAEAAVMRGDRLPPLHGIPVSIKDLLITRGVRTMYGSRIRETYVPEEDAPSVAKLLAEGAILIGKSAASGRCTDRAFGRPTFLRKTRRRWRSSWLKARS